MFMQVFKAETPIYLASGFKSWLTSSAFVLLLLFLLNKFSLPTFNCKMYISGKLR